MEIQVIKVEGEWVLPRISKKIEQHLPKGDGTGKKILFYCGYNAVPEKRIDNELRVSILTHDSHDGQFVMFAKRCDYVICVAPQYERQLRAEGIQHVKTLVLPVEDQFRPCKLVLAWIGHFYHAPRKGKDLYDKVKELPWVKLIHPDHVPFEELPDAYERCDYVLVTSRFDGGPFSLAEGLASGKKVIMDPTVGNAELFMDGVIPYSVNDFLSLRTVLARLYFEKKKLADLVAHLTWENWAKEVTKIFEEMDKWK